MTTSINNVFETTAVRNVIRGAVSSVVGALVAWGTTKWASLNASNLSYLVPVFSSAYFTAVHFLEKKYPKLGWLLGVLPQAKTVAPAVVTPTPAPAKPAAAKPSTVKVNATKATDAAKKATPKKK